ncbi:protein PXR1-like [Nicotiana tomentosiformis]|uniref:protein PXR1-like n=1 Tax=Nicotiana tomentosiformis TaxID=4098 RepID=UPI00388CBE8C
MRSLSEEEKEDSEEEDYDNVDLASFISARSRKEPPQGSTSKRPITRLQKKEEIESVLRKMASALVVNVDDEVEEELGPLVRKSSKKLTVTKSKRESSVSEKELRKVEGEKSGEKEDEKMVEESCEKVAEESAEKISRKSTEKGKSVRKSVKRKADASEEPGSSKKTKVGDTQDAGKEKLKNQKVL